jgi:heme/copper-type cytochrome/quinol oxidase subunit 3
MQASSTQHAPETRDTGEESSALLYRPALLVLYVGLIATYLVLRFVVAGAWPTRQDLGLEVLWAAIATLVLVFSSITISMAGGAAQADRQPSVRRWLLLTLVLGIAFGVVQLREYQLRWQHNLIPKPLSNSLHDRADLYYLSAVQQRLIQLATDINSDKVRQNQLLQQLQNAPDDAAGDRAGMDAELRRLQAEESSRTEHLAIVNRLLASEVRWTSTVVATTDELARQRLAMAALAYDILPLQKFRESHEQFRQLEAQQLDALQTTNQAGRIAAEASAKANSEPLKGLLSAVAEVKSEQQDLAMQLKSHLRQRAIEEDQDEAQPNEAQPNEAQADEDPQRISLERQLADVQQRLEECNAKLTAAAKLVTDAEDNASRLGEELRNIAARQATIAELDSGVGLNSMYPWLRLPVCIPGGTVWAWTYCVLTIVHAIHLAYALIAVLLVTGFSRGASLANTAPFVRNWHTMVTVWVLLFVLIYLI